MVESAARRAFLGGRAPRPAPLRPPWALAEAAFLDACTRCHACVDACPERVIARGDGGYPEITFADAGCTFCGACAAACAPRALLRRDGDRPWSALAAIGPACLPRQGVACQHCRDACEARAIAFPLTRAVPLPVLDDARCSGCGACVAVCPVGAIAVRPAEAAA